MTASEIDAEALLEERGQSSDQGGFRPLRTLAVAGSFLGLAAVVVPRWVGRETLTMRVAPVVDGLVELNSAKPVAGEHHIGLYIDANTDPAQCWEATKDETIIIEKCDEKSKNQVFTIDGFYIKHGDLCVKDDFELESCREKSDRQWTTWSMGAFGDNLKYGSIELCACAGPQDCPTECKDVMSITADGNMLKLEKKDFPKWTFTLDHAEPETHHIAVFLGSDTDPEKCLQAQGGEAVLKDCDREEDKQLFKVDGANILFDGKCMDDRFEFKDTCPDDESRWWTTWKNGDNGLIRNCKCLSSQDCPEDCSEARSILIEDGDLTLSKKGKAGTAFTFKLDHKHINPEPDYPCTANGENCLKSQCCSQAGMTCFGKNEEWASCNATCSENSKWNFASERWETMDYKVWGCSVVGAKPTCGKNGDNCIKSKCCEDPSSTCFRKNDEWASCNATCDHHMKWNHDEGRWEKKSEKVWDCSAMSCTKNGDDCSSSKCCSEPGMTCFKKNAKWSSCNATCDHNMKWVEGGWQRQDHKVWDCERLS